MQQQSHFPWERGISAPPRDPQSRASGGGNQLGFSPMGRLSPHHPRERTISLVHQPGKFTLIFICRSGHTEAQGWQRGLIHTPRSNSEGSSINWKNFGQRAKWGLNSVVWKRGLVLPTSSAQAMPLPTPAELLGLPCPDVI